MAKIIVLEGTDCSGKTTQHELLTARLQQAKIPVHDTSFPSYGNESSFFVRQYLKANYGAGAWDVDPKAASMFYALDRYHAFKTGAFGDAYRADMNILAARYTSSNAIHQSVKYENWDNALKCIQWIDTLEHETLGIPRADLTILLDMPPRFAKHLQAQRLAESGGLASSGESRDIHEEDPEYLARSYEHSIRVAQTLGWEIISCINKDGVIKSKGEINDELYEKVNTLYTTGGK